MQLGETLRALRIQAGFQSQMKAAAKIGTAQAFLCELENDRKFPSKKMLESISKAYGVPYQVILWMAMEIKDVPPKKREAFKLLKPSIDELIGEIFNE